MAYGICPYGNHPFEYTPKPGAQRVYCSDKHQWSASAQRQADRKSQLAERSCGKCKLVKATAEFSTPTAPYCKPCMAEYARAQRAANPDPLRSRRDSLARYGLTFEQFDALLAAQGGRCKICGSTEPGGIGGVRGWHVDHDHSCCNTRKRSCGKCVRGILCVYCNTGLGSLKEDPVVIRAALEYVLAYQALRAANGHEDSMVEIDAAVTG